MSEHMNRMEPVDSIAVMASVEGIPAHHTNWRERALFFINFLKNPLQNASVIPSSRHASAAIVGGLDWDEIKTVVELGPGNGTFTREILSKCKPGTNVILIELEDSYVELLQQKFGRRIHVYHESAHRMNEILADMGIDKADLIVSSLPFLEKKISREIFAAILMQTAKGAAFRFFTYMPPVMKWFYKGMPLHKVSFVLKNIPPMWIYGIN